MTAHNLDVKHLLCPLPVIKLSEKITKTAVGDTIKIIATDPGVINDIPAWIKIHGHQVLEIEQNDEIIIRVKKL